MTILKGAEPTIISGSIDTTIKMWHLDGKVIRTLEGHKNWVTSCKARIIVCFISKTVHRNIVYIKT